MRIRVDAGEEAARCLDCIFAVALVNEPELLPSLHSCRIGVEDAGEAGNAGFEETAIGREIFLHKPAALKRCEIVDAVGGLEGVGPVALPDELEPRPGPVLAVAAAEQHYGQDSGLRRPADGTLIARNSETPHGRRSPSQLPEGL